jgi:hypothetical protein
MEHAAFRVSRDHVGHGGIQGALLDRVLKGELILAKPAGRDGGMGHFGRVTSLKDLTPSRQFIECGKRPI